MKFDNNIKPGRKYRLDGTAGSLWINSELIGKDTWVASECTLVRDVFSHEKKAYVAVDEIAGMKGICLWVKKSALQAL